IFSLFNIETVGFDPNYYIPTYYDASLNQIGLMGQWFSGYGYLFFFPVFVYGFISGYIFKLYRNGSLVGLMLYPIVVVSLLDSFRGFLLFQNISVANIMFCLTFIFLWELLRSQNR